MGVEFHITRAAFWADNDDVQITPDEWLNYINNDNELRLYPVNGEYHAVWSGPLLYDEPWLDWRAGNIYTQWPDTFLYRKMLRIAQHFNAQVMDDEGTVYSDDAQWEFDPTHQR